MQFPYSGSTLGRLVKVGAISASPILCLLAHVLALLHAQVDISLDESGTAYCVLLSNAAHAGLTAAQVIDCSNPSVCPLGVARQLLYASNGFGRCPGF